MRTGLVSSALLVFVAATSLPAQRRDADYTDRRTATESVRGARLIHIEAGAGSLTIEGRPGLGEVRARGTAFASSRELLDQIRITTRREGDVIEIIADIPEQSERSGRRYDGRWIAGLDLIIEVPDSIALDVEDGSGEIEIQGVRSIELQDGSGNVKISRVGGDVRVSDGSGELSITDVRGSLEIDEDGSGTLEARNVRGSVRVGSKGSGSVDVEDVGGDLVVARKGSGTIEYREVRGKVDVPDRGRGRARDRARARWRDR